MRNICLSAAIILLAVALAISLALNKFLFSQGKWYYKQVEAGRLDPLGLSYFESSPTTTGTGKTRVVFLGDSRAAYWPAPSAAEGFEFVNRGIGNQTSAQVLLRFDAHVRPLRPAMVIVQVGINDLKAIPLFPERKDKIIIDCEENIRQIITRSVDQGATVIVTTVFPVGRVSLDRQLFWSPDVARAVNQVNAYIRSLQSSGVIILDTYAILADRNGMLQAQYAQDTLHLNPTGYGALNQALERILAYVPR